MANQFLSELASQVGTTPTTVFTCPANTQTTIIGLSVSNVSVTSPVYVSAILDGSNRTSGAEASVYMVKEAPVLGGGTLVIVGGDQKIVLEPGDQIKVVSNTASSVDVILSHLDITSA